MPDAQANRRSCASGTGGSDVPGAGESCAPYGKTNREGERTKPCPARPAEGAPSDPRGRERPGREERPRSTASSPLTGWDQLVAQAADRVRRREAPRRRDVAVALAGLGSLNAALTGWCRLRACVLVAEMIDEQRLEPERIAARIQRACDRFYDRGESVRDVYGFLTRIALPAPYGCQDPACEDGRLWPDGAACRACLERRRDKGADRRRTQTTS